MGKQPNANLSKEVKEALKKIEPLFNELLNHKNTNLDAEYRLFSNGLELSKIRLKNYADFRSFIKFKYFLKERIKLYNLSFREKIILMHDWSTDEPGTKFYEYSFEGLKEKFLNSLNPDESVKYLVNNQIHYSERLIEEYCNKLNNVSPQSFDYSLTIILIEEREKYINYLRKENPQSDLRHQSYFIWRGNDNKRQIKNLYNLLIKASVINNKTNEESFTNIFNGGRSGTPPEIIWNLGESDLAYFFEELIANKYLSINTSYNSIIKNNRVFISSNGKDFKNLKQAKQNYLKNSNNNSKPKNASIIDGIMNNLSA